MSAASTAVRGNSQPLRMWWALPHRCGRRMMAGGGERKLADYDPYEGAFSDDFEYEYDSRDDVYKGNVASFTTKEVQKIKAKGITSFCRKFKKWHCPYCTTKPKPKNGRFDHLLSHAEDVAIRGEDYKIRGQHAALAKALTPA
ncbi:lrr receptor-like serine threonine-protein kinase [Hordeum vulgare]|nr:lrr receptor-like serine threonine-protein kinase [Hordeum vulgare]